MLNYVVKCSELCQNDRKQDESEKENWYYQILQREKRKRNTRSSDCNTLRKVKKKSVNSRHKTNLINSELQDELWNLDHYLTDNHLGRLFIYILMQVMITNNKATECCITNDAEAEVVMLGDSW